MDKEPLIWGGMKMPTNDHEWRCQCKECIVIRWLKEVKEVQALREILQQRKARWGDLTEEEVDTLRSEEHTSESSHSQQSRMPSSA